MNLEEFKNESIALVVWNTEKEEDVHLYLGRLHFENSAYYFVNQEKGWRVSLNEELLNRLKPVPNELKEMLLDADFTLSVNLGSLPKSDTSGHQSTGLNWHDLD